MSRRRRNETDEQRARRELQKLGGWSSDIIMKSVYTHTTSYKEIEYQKIIDGYFNGIIDKESAK